MLPRSVGHSYGQPGGHHSVTDTPLILDVASKLVYRWVSVVDSEPALNQTLFLYLLFIGFIGSKNTIC